MNDMLKYIFGQLQRTQESMRSIEKALKKQKRTNRTLAGLLFVSGFYIAALYSSHIQQEKKIEELESKIEGGHGM